MGKQQQQQQSDSFSTNGSLSSSPKAFSPREHEQGTGQQQQQQQQQQYFYQGSTTSTVREQSSKSFASSAQQFLQGGKNTNLRRIPKRELEILQERAKEYERQATLNNRLKEQQEYLEEQLRKTEQELEQTLKQNEEYEEDLELDQEQFLARYSSRRKEFASDGNNDMDADEAAQDSFLGTEQDKSWHFLPEPTFEKSLEEGVRNFSKRNYVAARFHFLQAREYARRESNQRGEGRAEGNLSNVYASIGKPKRAWVHFKRALNIFRKEQDTTLEGLMLSNGVICAIQLGQFDEALGLALRKLAISVDPREKTEAEDWIDKVNQAINNEIILEFDHDARLGYSIVKSNQANQSPRSRTGTAVSFERTSSGFTNDEIEDIKYQSMMVDTKIGDHDVGNEDDDTNLDNRSPLM